MSTPLVEIRGLTKSYPHPEQGEPLKILRGIDLTILRGETFAIVGMSGAGKSTFLQILGALDVPSSGKILFESQDVFAMPPEELALFRNRSIGFVFQFHHLLPDFTARENVAMPCLISRIPRVEAFKRAEELLKEVGLGHRLDHRPTALSGGEQQRVAIARALVMRPNLVLADEPTGNLDRRTSEEIHRVFFRLNREREVALLVVTHNPVLAEFAQRRVEMFDGKLREITEESRTPSSPPPTPREIWSAITTTEATEPKAEPAAPPTGPAGPKAALPLGALPPEREEPSGEPATEERPSEPAAREAVSAAVTPEARVAPDEPERAAEAPERAPKLSAPEPPASAAAPAERRAAEGAAKSPEPEPPASPGGPVAAAPEALAAPGPTPTGEAAGASRSAEANGASAQPEAHAGSAEANGASEAAATAATPEEARAKIASGAAVVGAAPAPETSPAPEPAAAAPAKDPDS
jgi:lipoprotein-releasing system ATP-binding protein